MGGSTFGERGGRAGRLGRTSHRGREALESGLPLKRVPEDTRRLNEERVVRSTIIVRPVGCDDVPALVKLWIEQRVDGGSTEEAACRRVDEDAVASSLARDGVHALIAWSGEEAVGFTVLFDTTRNVLADNPFVSIEGLYVRRDARRHGVARALLGATVRYAERLDAGVLVTSVPAGDREANRFFARLGFTPQVMRRTVTTAALQRRLFGTTDRRTSFDALLARRRTARTQRAQALPATSTHRMSPTG